MENTRGEITDSISGSKNGSTSSRKLDHIETILNEKVFARKKTNGLEDVHFVHTVAPEISMKNIDTKIKLFQKTLKAPLIISGMTGGHIATEKINSTLAKAAESKGLAMGVGSQRAAIEDPSLEPSFKVARESGPNVFLVGNLGVPQLVEGYGLQEAQTAVEMISANALAIHFNPLQEAIQPEGDADFQGALSKLQEIVEGIKPLPIIAKAVGIGIPAEDIRRLEATGVAGVDIAGVGGTSWAGVEAIRAEKLGDSSRAKLGSLFWDWGSTTTICTIEASFALKKGILIASGGVRNGIEVAKLLALGADAVGIAAPFLKAANEGHGSLVNVIDQIIQELSLTMFLVGATNIEDLRRIPLHIVGNTAEFLMRRGIDLSHFSSRQK